MSTLNFVMHEIYVLLMQDVTAYKISTRHLLYLDFFLYSLRNKFEFLVSRFFFVLPKKQTSMDAYKMLICVVAVTSPS